MPSSHLIIGRPLLLLPPIPPSIRVFSNESTLRMRCQSTGASALASFLPKKSQGWSPSEWTGWISLRVQVTQESSPTPQFKCINSSVLSFLYVIQFSHPYMTTGKTIALTRRTFVGKVMSLLLNMLSRLVITFQGCPLIELLFIHLFSYWQRVRSGVRKTVTRNGIVYDWNGW